eukprot:g8133.t1
MCTSGKIVGPIDPQTKLPTGCKVAFGIDTKTFLGVLGDDVAYELKLEAPRVVGGGKRGVKQARVVSDTGKNGFAYGDRLVYDWVFLSREENGTVETEVSLNLFLQVNSVMYLPIWDALQQVLTEQMLQAFEVEARKRSALRKNK